jgi:hypothetical protein
MFAAAATTPLLDAIETSFEAYLAEESQVK